MLRGTQNQYVAFLKESKKVVQEKKHPIFHDSVLEGKKENVSLYMEDNYRHRAEGYGIKLSPFLCIMLGYRRKIAIWGAWKV